MNQRAIVMPGKPYQMHLPTFEDGCIGTGTPRINVRIQKMMWKMINTSQSLLACGQLSDAMLIVVFRVACTLKH